MAAKRRCVEKLVELEVRKHPDQGRLERGWGHVENDDVALSARACAVTTRGGEEDRVASRPATGALDRTTETVEADEVVAPALEPARIGDAQRLGGNPSCHLRRSIWDLAMRALAQARAPAIRTLARKLGPRARALSWSSSRCAGRVLTRKLGLAARTLAPKIGFAMRALAPRLGLASASRATIGGDRLERDARWAPRCSAGFGRRRRVGTGARGCLDPDRRRGGGACCRFVDVCETRHEHEAGQDEGDDGTDHCVASPFRAAGKTRSGVGVNR